MDGELGFDDAGAEIFSALATEVLEQAEKVAKASTSTQPA